MNNKIAISIVLLILVVVFASLYCLIASKKDDENGVAGDKRTIIYALSSAKMNEESDEQISFSVRQNGDGTNTFESLELNIAFLYPSDWGDLVVHSTRGQCPEGVSPCNLVWVETVMNNSTSSVFSTISPKWHQYRRGNGGWWANASAATLLQTPQNYSGGSPTNTYGKGNDNVEYVCAIGSPDAVSDFNTWIQHCLVWTYGADYPGFYFGIPDPLYPYKEPYRLSEQERINAKSTPTAELVRTIVRTVRTVR
jgi:hypothetical protein